MFVLNYLAVPATEFDRLAVDDDQVDAVHELLESAEYPTTDIDKAWGPLSMVVGESPIMGAIAGTQEWDEEVTANPPALVAEQAAALAAADGAQLAAAANELDSDTPPEYVADAVAELTRFYQAAANRGDAIIIVVN